MEKFKIQTPGHYIPWLSPEQATQSQNKSTKSSQNFWVPTCFYDWKSIFFEGDAPYVLLENIVGVLLETLQANKQVFTSSARVSKCEFILTLAGGFQPEKLIKESKREK